MLKKPLFSIITICKNSANTIGKTLKSVESQSYPLIEYIVIDCVSSDGTLDIVKASPAVSKWVSEPDEGVADAFNKGISIASGEWVGILNADDWYEIEAIATVAQHIEHADVIHGPVRYWRDDGTKQIFYPNQALLRREMTINHPSVFVRRAVYKDVGGFDRSFRLAMDYELLLRILKSGYRFHCISKYVLVNMRSGGLSDIYWKEALGEVMRAKELHYPSLLMHKVYYCFQIFRSVVQKVLTMLGMQFCVNYYRRFFSLMRKK
jgi:glycosyltransferase involved in cell wall biosynthesis